MLVLTLGGFLQTGGVPTRWLGGFRIVYQMMGLIGDELDRTCGVGHLDHQYCPYHHKIRDFVGLAVRVMRVCHWRVSRVDALGIVREMVRMAAESSARAFVRLCPYLDGMGVCPICQEGYKLGGYGVLLCGHIMHRQCRLEYEAYERSRAPHRLPECSICRSRFEGFACIAV